MLRITHAVNNVSQMQHQPAGARGQPQSTRRETVRCPQGAAGEGWGCGTEPGVLPGRTPSQMSFTGTPACCRWVCLPCSPVGLLRWAVGEAKGSGKRSVHLFLGKKTMRFLGANSWSEQLSAIHCVTLGQPSVAGGVSKPC